MFFLMLFKYTFSVEDGNSAEGGGEIGIGIGR